MNWNFVQQNEYQNIFCKMSTILLSSVSPSVRIINVSVSPIHNVLIPTPQNNLCHLFIHVKNRVAPVVNNYIVQRFRLKVKHYGCNIQNQI